MDYTDWLVLKTLLTEKNITTAAEKLFITQPALTYRIKNLEEELGVPLLVRFPKGVAFTSEGLIAAQYAEEMLRQYGNMKNIIASMDKVVRGSVYVAVSPAFAHYPLAELVSEFRRYYPHINIYINTYMSSAAVKKLLEDEVQVAIVRGNHDVRCKKVFLGSKPISLIAKDKVKLSELQSMPYIKYETDVTLEHDIADWWREYYDASPQTIMHLNDSFFCRQMVAKGMGYTILPAFVSYKDSLFKLYEQPLIKKNGEPLLRPSWVLYKEHTEKILAAKAFIDFMKEHFANN